MKQNRSSSVEGGFPLAAVVLLVTTVAALLACIDMQRIREGLDSVLPTAGQGVAIALTVLVGIGLGAMLGLTRRRRVAGFFLGGFIGALSALAIVPLTLAPADLWRCLTGMALLVVTSVAVRWNAR